VPLHVAWTAGCNSFRLSIEWSRIYPRRGVVDQSAVDRYHQIFDCLDRRAEIAGLAGCHSHMLSLSMHSAAPIHIP